MRIFSSRRVLSKSDLRPAILPSSSPIELILSRLIIDMEKFVEQGKIRSLGLSNWYIEEIDDFIAQVNIKPALVQNEIHPYYQEQEVIPYIHDLGIVMQAWYPLGGRGHQKELLSDKTILEIAENHGKSAAQVILRWDLQNGVVVIPGSSNPEHILENISLFDFELTDEEMEKIAALDRNEKCDILSEIRVKRREHSEFVVNCLSRTTRSFVTA